MNKVLIINAEQEVKSYTATGDGKVFMPLMQKLTMEKRVIGLILVILGVLGLITGGYYFVVHANGVYNTKMVAVYAILGFVFFISGLGLIRRTRDVIKKDEHVS